MGEAYGQDETEIIIADELIDWSERPAFYIDAPASLATAMKDALRSATSEQSALCASGANTAWLCSERSFRIFVGVSGDGSSLLSGYACSNSEDIPNLKYYREELVAYSPCVQIEWDEEARKYDVYEAEEYD